MVPWYHGTMVPWYDGTGILGWLARGWNWIGRPLHEGEKIDESIENPFPAFRRTRGEDHDGESLSSDSASESEDGQPEEHVRPKQLVDMTIVYREGGEITLGGGEGGASNVRRNVG